MNTLPLVSGVQTVPIKDNRNVEDSPKSVSWFQCHSVNLLKMSFLTKGTKSVDVNTELSKDKKKLKKKAEIEMKMLELEFERRRRDHDEQLRV